MKVDNVKIFCHNSVMINASKKIYIDPFKIEENFNDADYIFCTHSHYDHYSEEDITKLIKNNTILFVTQDIYEQAINFIGDEKRVFCVVPNKEYDMDSLKIYTVPAYNINKKFHPREKGWVGYIISIDNVTYYIAGDTDNVPEIRDINCDIAFLPVGGIYTMDVEEAICLSEKINAKCIIPTHYGLIVGNKDDGEKLKKMVTKKVEVLI